MKATSDFAGAVIVLLAVSLGAFSLAAESLTPVEQKKLEEIAAIKKDFEEKLKAVPTQVSGRATLPDGTPAVGFKIGGWGRSMTHGGYGHFLFDTVTDENGNFSLDLYRPALYWITINDPNTVYVAPDRHIELTEPLEPNTIRFQLQQGIPVAGVVIDCDKNEPVAGLPIYLLHDPMHWKEMNREDRFEHEKKKQVYREVQSDQQGRFQFAALPNEKYMVSFDSIHGSQPPTEADAPIYTRTFTSGMEPIRLEFSIPTPWRGRLLQKDGSPAASFPVFIVMRFDNGSYWSEPVTDAAGYFMYYRAVPLESLSVEIFNLGQGFYRDFDGQELPPNPVFQLYAPITAKGQLLRKSTGKPMRNFKFASRPRSYTTDIVSTDENGNFELTKLHLNNEARLCFLNEPDDLNTCALFEVFHRFTPTEPDKVLELGVLELEESGWLEPNYWANLVGKGIIIDGMTLDGQVFDWTKYDGKVVLVDFWATWCGPCLEEIPRLKTLYEKYHDKGFDVVGISVDRDLAALEKGLAKHQFPWVNLSDEKRKEAGQMAMSGRFGISAVPRCILVGRDGKVISVEARGVVLETELQRLYGDVP